MTDQEIIERAKAIAREIDNLQGNLLFDDRVDLAEKINLAGPILWNLAMDLEKAEA